MNLKRVKLDAFECSVVSIGMIPVSQWLEMISPWDETPEWEGEVISILSANINLL